MTYFEEHNNELVLVGDSFDLKINAEKEVLYRRKDWERFKSFKKPKKVFCSEMTAKKKNLKQLYQVLEQQLQASLLNVEEEEKPKEKVLEEKDEKESRE